MRRSLLDEPSFFMKPLLYTKSGKPVFPIQGGATDEDPFPSGEAQNEDEEDDQDGDTDTGGAESEGEEDDEPKKGSGSSKIAELSKENAQRRNANKRLTAEVDELKKALQQFTDKDKSEGDKALARVAELETEHAELQDKFATLRMEMAFVKQQKYQLRNPALALKVVDLSEVEVDDDGEVIGLDKALEALKKSDPYLFKDSGDDDDQDDNPSKKQRTGESPGRKDKNTVNREALLRKYPALQR